MKKTMIITSVRPALMNRFLKSFQERGMNNSWSIALMTQCYSASELEELKNNDITNSVSIIDIGKRTPPYIAKRNL